MARAETRMHKLWRAGVRAWVGACTYACVPVCMLVCVLALTGLTQTHAQTQPPTGSPSDVRYTAPAAGSPGNAALLPRAPGQDAQAPLLFRGEQAGVDYAANAAVGRIVVDVDRDAVPADGQAPVKLTVRLFARDGKPLAVPAKIGRASCRERVCSTV